MSGVAGGGRKGGVEPRGAGAGARGRRRVRDAEKGEGAVRREAKESCWRPRRLAARRGGANGGAERLISASRAGGKRPGKKPGARKKGGAQGRADEGREAWRRRDERQPGDGHLERQRAARRHLERRGGALVARGAAWERGKRCGRKSERRGARRSRARRGAR
jgi:hypothetical protein